MEKHTHVLGVIRPLLHRLKCTVKVLEIRSVPDLFIVGRKVYRPPVTLLRPDWIGVVGGHDEVGIVVSSPLINSLALIDSVYLGDSALELLRVAEFLISFCGFVQDDQHLPVRDGVELAEYFIQIIIVVQSEIAKKLAHQLSKA